MTNLDYLLKSPKEAIPSTMSSSSKCSSSLRFKCSFSLRRLFNNSDCSIRALSYCGVTNNLVHLDKLNF